MEDKKLYKVKFNHLGQCAEVCPIHVPIVFSKTCIATDSRIGSVNCMHWCPYNLDVESKIENGFIWCSKYNELLYNKGEQIELFT